jgi:hypothetical protein
VDSPFLVLKKLFGFSEDFQTPADFASHFQTPAGGRNFLGSSPNYRERLIELRLNNGTLSRTPIAPLTFLLSPQKGGEGGFFAVHDDWERIHFFYYSEFSCSNQVKKFEFRI